MSEKKFLLFLFLSLFIAAQAFIILPERAVSAQSDDVMLGTGNICNPEPGKSENTDPGYFCILPNIMGSAENPIPGAWIGCYVYYGSNDGSPIRYRVLSNNETAFGGNTMLLNSLTVVAQKVFDCVSGQDGRVCTRTADWSLTTSS